MISEVLGIDDNFALLVLENRTYMTYEDERENEKPRCG
jgi:hypothetical protein